MDHMDDVETDGRSERFDALFPQIKPDIGMLLFLEFIPKAATSDWVRIDSRVFNSLRTRCDRLDQRIVENTAPTTDAEHPYRIQARVM